ncbi:tat (twin-arginine translocation) pathway signal sequence [Spiribacter roseus]|nr:tat (twin-arginine translocation) pathway signal sequence [Spiribacter roseus]
MLEQSMNRRRFLKGSGSTLMGTLAMTSMPIAILAPSRSWALELQQLDAHQGEVLLTLTRHIFPHPTLEDAVYALVVKDLDAEAAANPSTADTMRSGIAALDNRAGGDWLALDDEQQGMHVRAIAGSDLFRKVQSTAVVSLYNNEMAFRHFGYGGERGDAGYLSRGFNDLTWLPDLPASASGPVPGMNG